MDDALNPPEKDADADPVINSVVDRVNLDQPLADPSLLSACELTVVMPVYNEEASLPACARSWLAILDELGIDYRLLVIDDGSRDATGSVLGDLNRHDRVLGISKPNEGHGPTILRGYHLAARTSEWVFQVDSDDEIPATAFPPVWQARDGVDAVFGVRTGREQSIDRRLISRVAALTARVLLRARVRDVNVPFRLMRSEPLLPVIDELPAATFAPNVVIAGVLSRSKERFVEVQVPHHERQAGEVSIVGWGAIRAAVRSFRQTVRLSRRL